MRIIITGIEKVKSWFTRIADVEWDDIQSDEADDLKQKSDAIVPVDTGALRDSAHFEDGVFGYSVEYAAHVNYGHRTSNGGFVPGRHFLEEIVEGEDEEYKQKVLKNLMEASNVT